MLTTCRQGRRCRGPSNLVPCVLYTTYYANYARCTHYSTYSLTTYYHDLPYALDYHQGQSELMEAVMQQWLHTAAGQAA